jgi:hypothetical protein
MRVLLIVHFVFGVDALIERGGGYADVDTLLVRGVPAPAGPGAPVPIAPASEVTCLLLRPGSAPASQGGLSETIAALIQLRHS